MARGLKFRIKEEEELYYPCSENKGTDQLRNYPEADLRLCFRICKKPVFLRRGSYDFNPCFSTDEALEQQQKSLNVLADLLPRCENEQEYLLRWLQSPEAKGLSLRMRNMTLVELKVGHLLYA